MKKDIFQPDFPCVFTVLNYRHLSLPLSSDRNQKGISNVWFCVSNWLSIRLFRCLVSTAVMVFCKRNIPKRIS